MQPPNQNPTHNFDVGNLVNPRLSEKKPETVGAAGRLNKQRGSILLMPRMSLCALGPSIRRICRFLEELADSRD
jgi:hypothetical protein